MAAAPGAHGVRRGKALFPIDVVKRKIADAKTKDLPFTMLQQNPKKANSRPRYEVYKLCTTFRSWRHCGWFTWRGHRPGRGTAGTWSMTWHAAS